MKCQRFDFRLLISLTMAALTAEQKGQTVLLHVLCLSSEFFAASNALNLNWVPFGLIAVHIQVLAGQWLSSIFCKITSFLTIL